MEHTRHPYIGHLTIVQAIAQTLAAYLNCEKSGNAEWRLRHRETLQTIIDNFLPSGSGINHGTRLDDRSTPDRIILLCDFHHMSEHGYYDGWTSHQIVITPSLVHDFTLRITGRDRNGIKEYLCDTYGYALREVINEQMFDCIWPREERPGAQEPTATKAG